MKSVATALLLVAVCFIGSKTAASQVVPAAVGPGAYVAIGASISDFQAVYGQRTIAGALLYADVHPQWRVGFEGEARFLRYHTSEDVTETNYIGGVRVVVLETHHWEPYAKVLAGMGRITLPFGYAHGSFLVLAPGAGVDFVLNHDVTIRAVDFEYQHWLDFPYGTLNPYGVSAGIRVRVTPRAWIPKGVHKRRVHA